MRLNRRVAAMTVVGVCAFGLVGCGSGDSAEDAFEGESADAIAAKAIEATRDADSMRMLGQVEESGQSLTIDMAMDDRSNCQGTITQEGAKAEVRRTGETLYLRGDEKYWQASLKGGPGSDEAVDKAAGKWVKVPGQGDEMAGMCDKQKLVAALDEDKSERQGLKKDGTAEVDGTQAVKLTKESGDETHTLFVAAEGEPYVLKAVVEGGTAPQTTTFSDYGDEVRPEQPADGDTVDIEEIVGASS
ncbi:hypothetical protein [Streptomyces sp. NPDC058867]|uniref:hypothetical protein n=1 Tax=unclassified Streptomyces TaxID=2593676 RepID=UPI0036BECADC